MSTLFRALSHRRWQRSNVGTARDCREEVAGLEGHALGRAVAESNRDAKDAPSQDAPAVSEVKGQVVPPQDSSVVVDGLRSSAVDETQPALPLWDVMAPPGEPWRGVSPACPQHRPAVAPPTCGCGVALQRHGKTLLMLDGATQIDTRSRTLGRSSVALGRRVVMRSPGAGAARAAHEQQRDLRSALFTVGVSGGADARAEPYLKPWTLGTGSKP